MQLYCRKVREYLGYIAKYVVGRQNILRAQNGEAEPCVLDFLLIRYQQQVQNSAIHGSSRWPFWRERTT